MSMDVVLLVAILLGVVIAVELARWYVNVSKRLEQSQMLVEYLSGLEQQAQGETN